jgi:hypothetical protein
MLQQGFTPNSADTRVDLLTLAFKAACQNRQIETASSLLSEIDSALLGDPMGSKDLANALMRVRAFRDDLERLRLETPVSAPSRQVAAETVTA